MSIETTLYSTLTADAAVTTFVSTRIYPQLAPPDAQVPYISYQVIATESYNVQPGRPTSERKVVQINIVSDSYLEAKNIAEAVKDALELIGHMQGERDTYFSETQNHRVSVDFAFIQ